MCIINDSYYRSKFFVIHRLHYTITLHTICTTYTICTVLYLLLFQFLSAAIDDLGVLMKQFNPFQKEFISRLVNPQTYLIFLCNIASFFSHHWIIKFALQFLFPFMTVPLTLANNACYYFS